MVRMYLILTDVGYELHYQLGVLMQYYIVINSAMYTSKHTYQRNKSFKKYESINVVLIAESFKMIA